jgi:hypothetical protein
MKSVIIISMFLAGGALPFKAPAQTLSSEPQLIIVEGDTIVHALHNLPVFPGGDDALRTYFKKHLPELKYTGKKQSSDIWITFVIKKDGSVGKLNIISNDKPELNPRLTTAIKSLPAFSPGLRDGKAVATVGEITFDF